MSTWKPLAGRVSFIADAPATEKPIASSLFLQAWGTDPQSFQQNPNPLAPSIAQGVRSGMLATCAVLPNRIDFALAPHAKGAQADRPTLVAIDSLIALYEELTRVAGRLRDGTLLVPTPFARPAVFLQFLSHEETRPAANQRIVGVIPSSYRPKLEEEESFALQLSRPLRIGDVSTNVLTKWSVETFQVFWFGIQATAGGAASFSTRVEHFLGACVAFDIGPPGQTGFSFGAPAPPGVVDRSKQAEIIFSALQYVDRMLREYGLDLESISSVTTTH